MARGIWLIPICLTAAAAAQQAQVELKMDAGVLQRGEIADVQLVCTNTGMPSAPQAVVPEGLELSLVNSAPSTFAQTTIDKGRRSQTTTYTYLLRLTALKEGTYALGPLKVVADGQTLESNVVKVVVKAADPAGSRSDQYLFAEIEVSPTSVYVSQAYTATLTFGIRKVVIDGRTYPLDLLNDVLVQRDSQLSVFAGGSVTKTETRLSDAAGQSHVYEVYKVTQEIRADQVGEARVGPVFLRANYPTRLSRGFFNSLEVAAARKESARAEAVTVTVKAPPNEGRPADYAGAIGRYTLTVEAKPVHLALGEPITLAIAIRGAPLEGVAGPALSRQPELVSRFDFTADELVGDMEGGAKVFRRAIFPKQAGTQTVPPLSWSFFDSQAERYVTLTSEPITITVSAPDSSGTLVGSLRPLEAQEGATELRPLTGGVSPNYVDPELVLADQSLSMGPAWAVSLAAPPLAYLGLFVLVRRRERLRRDPGLARRQQALRTAQARIRLAERNGQPAVRLQSLSQALTGYVCDRCNLPPGALTAQEVRGVLGTLGVGDDVVREIGSFLDECDAAVYAAGASGAVPADAAARVQRWLTHLERCTR
ncbi:MAG: BatD family protein [Planctomycetes bacterium]|nr:BatD family protein [Planctomycetota bacterium]